MWVLQDIHYISTLLHPSLKHFHIATDEKSKAIELTKEEILKYQAYETSANSTIDSLSSSSIQSVKKLKCTPTSPTTHNVLAQCFDLLVDDEDKAPAPSKDKELIDYLASKDTLEPEEDILLFWKKHQPSFPTLAGIVKSIYCVPASNTTVERLFSSAGNTITDRRSNLDSERVNKILFLNKNLLPLKDIERQQSTQAPEKRKLSVAFTLTITILRTSTMTPMMMMKTINLSLRRSPHQPEQKSIELLISISAKTTLLPKLNDICKMTSLMLLCSLCTLSLSLFH